MKKLLLGLGAVTAVVAPIASVVACGNGSGVAPGKTGTAALDISEARTLSVLTAKLKALQSTYAGQEGTKDAMRIFIKDGSHTLDVTFLRSKANDAAAMNSIFSKIKAFFTTVLQDRSIDASKLSDIENLVGAPKNA